MKDKIKEALSRNISATLPGMVSMACLTFITQIIGWSTQELKIQSILWLIGCVAFVFLSSLCDGVMEYIKEPR